MMNEKLIARFSDAVMYGDLDEVQTIISETPKIVNAGDEYGFTALHNAMAEEQKETISYIIEKGANVNAQNDDGIAPLHIACTIENAKLLIEAGADINLKDNNGNTPLHIHASERDSDDVIQYLVRNGAQKEIRNNFKKQPIDIATSREDKRKIKLLS
jgi:ankyrin repeat protein